MKKINLAILIFLAVSLNCKNIKISANQGLPLVEYSAHDLYETEIFFNLLEYELDKNVVENEEYSKITIPSEGGTFNLGKPDLPSITRLFAVPNQGEVEIEVTGINDGTINDILLYPKQPLPTESNRREIPFSLNEDFYRNGELYPENIAVVGEPVILRDLRVVPVTFNPFQYDPQSRELRIINNIDLTLKVSGRGGINTKTAERERSRAFEKIYQSIITNYEIIREREDDYQTPSYLFIYPEAEGIAGYLQDLVEWKHQKGFEVTAVSTAIAGTDQIAILNYIQEAYDNWENPPEYICLVGDAGGAYNIPTGHYVNPPYTGEGDQVYSTLEGNDILADVIVGRLSFNSIIEFQTILSKILNYEKNPYLGNPNWFNSAVLVGDPTDSGQSCVDTKIYIRDMMGVSVPNITCTEVYSGNWVTEIANGLNAGASYFNYRGFVAMSGWSVNHISNSLNNGYMLPFAVAITCLTGNFEGTTDCISERFLKAGSPSVPKGAIAAISTATGYTHTCFNNLIDAAIYEGVFVDEIFTPGGALVKGKLVLYNTYPQNPFDYVVKFSYWNNLMGDPGLELWSDIPEELNLIYESEISVGTNNLVIDVTDENGIPVEDVWVTILKGDDEIFVSDYSNAAGQVILPVIADIAGEVTITASKHNYIPEIQQVEIVESETFVNLHSFTIDDDEAGLSSGNNDGLINPGEIIELEVNLMNYGTFQVNGVSATIETTSSDIILLEPQEDFYSIAAGSSSSGNFLLQLDENATGNLEFVLNLFISDDSGNNWTDLIYLSSFGPHLEITGYFIEDGNDNIFQPGETVDLQLIAGNIGITDLENILATISCNDSRITINDAEGEFGNIPAEGQQTNSADLFNISAANSIVPGSMISFGIEFYNASGYSQNNSFSLQIGDVSVNDPLGPDAFGHYIYDNDDLQYINTKPFEWVEIDPQYGGSGTVITSLVDPGNMGTSAEIPLPFSMTFFGITYSSITVCSNGWFAPGSVDLHSFMNWNLPGPLGPSPMVAVFWDDLKMGDVAGNNYIPNGGKVCYYFDEVEDRFIIEWSRLRNKFDNQLETFQAIIYDPYIYPTSHGDSQLLLQYLEVNNTDQGSYENFLVNHGQYATIGIEDHLGSDGLEYTYNNVYPAAAAPVDDYTALTISGSPVSTDDPYIVFNGYELNDSNGNGQFDYAESAELSIALKNLGGITATNVSAIITTDDEYVEVLNPFSEYDDIATGAVEYSLSDFSLQIADICPDQHMVILHLEVQSDQGNAVMPFNIMIRAPEIVLSSVRVNDINNSLLDPGETAPVSLIFSNTGGSVSNDLSAEIMLNSNFVSTNNSSVDLGMIESFSNSTAELEFSADAGVEIGAEIIISWVVSDEMGYEFSGDIPFYIAQVPVNFREDFNSFPPEGWELEGGTNWIGNYSNAAGGTPPEALFWGGTPYQTSQRLISAPVNTLGSNQLILEFRQNLMPLSSDFAAGIATSNDGIFWNNVISYNDVVPTQITQLIIDTPDVGSAEFRFSFYFEGDTESINYWALDNIVLDHVPIVPQAFIIGTVTLADGNGNVQETLLSAGDFSANPSETGEFNLRVVPGIYDISAFLPGYLRETVTDFEVLLPWTTHYLDFILTEATMEYPPQNLTSEINIYHVHLNWDPPGFNRDERNFPPEVYEIPDLLSDSDNRNKHTEIRSQTGFNLYRNGILFSEINEISVTHYDDMELDAGLYEYYVTAVFDEGESEASNSTNVEIILPPPANLAANSTPTGLNVILSWESPNDYVTGYRIYRNNIFIAETNGLYYFDADLDPGIYFYGLTALYNIYESEPSLQEIELTNSSDDLNPLVTSLSGNHPNPFNPETTINYQLAENSFVQLGIYNIKGQLVRILVSEELKAGFYEVIWNGTDDNDRQVSSGVYYCILRTEDKSARNKLILIK
ncbi:MAG: hypothetical protein APR54_07110 [Candidatus Cloacimonas sp. SDB]|nr:MAG: hypothetical protein APR54_07110 [Candidatus Cloacimonas sp. SDB]